MYMKNRAHHICQTMSNHPLRQKIKSSLRVWSMQNISISLRMEPSAPIPPYPSYYYPSYYYAEKILTDYGKEWSGLYERRIAICEAMARITKS